jgi:hypothetical protein
LGETHDVENSSTQLDSLAERVVRWSCEVPAATFFLMLSMLTVLRCGWQKYEAIDPLLEFARSFPAPSNSYKANSVLGVALAALVGATKRTPWWRLHGLVTLALTAVTLYLVVKSLGDRASRRHMGILLFSSSAPVVALQLVGHYDVFTLFGATLLGLGTSVAGAAVGGLVVGASNGEQGLVMAACALLVAFALRLGQRRRLAAFAAACLLARVGVLYWLQAYGVSASGRGALLGENLRRALHGFLHDGTTAIYSWHGPLWVVVALAIWAHRSAPARMASLAAGLIAIPAAAAVTSLDGTRVFVCCVWPSLCLLTREWSAGEASWTRELPREKIAGFVLLAIPVLPAYLTWVDGRLLPPWDHFTPLGK